MKVWLRLVKYLFFTGMLLALAACKVTGISVGSPEVTASEETITAVSWFSLKPEAAKDWKLVPDPEDESKFSLLPKTPLTGEEHQVFVLFPKPSSAYDTAMSKILSLFLEKQVPTTFTAVNYQDDLALGQAALAFAQAEGFDLIFSMGSQSTDFIYQNFQHGPIPVVSVTSKDPVLLGQMKDYETGSGTNIAYTSLNVPVELQMAYLKELKPTLQTIAILYAEDNISAKETQAEPLREIAEKEGIRVIDVVVLDQSQARQELETKVPAAATEMSQADPDQQNSIFWITGSTSVFSEIKTINQGAGRIPVLSVVPDVVQEGDDSAVLSVGVSFESNAHLAAIYAIDILSDQVEPGELKVGIVSPPDIAINFKRAKEIGLKIPFSFFESSSFVYNYQGEIVRKEGQFVQ